MHLKKVLIECVREDGKEDILELELINDEWVLYGCYPGRFICKFDSYAEQVDFLHSEQTSKLFKNQIWNYCFEKGNKS